MRWAPSLGQDFELLTLYGTVSAGLRACICLISREKRSGRSTRRNASRLKGSIWLIPRPLAGGGIKILTHQSRRRPNEKPYQSAPGDSSVWHEIDRSLSHPAVQKHREVSLPINGVYRDFSREQLPKCMVTYWVSIDMSKFADISLTSSPRSFQVTRKRKNKMRPSVWQITAVKTRPKRRRHAIVRAFVKSCVKSLFSSAGIRVGCTKRQASRPVAAY